MAVVRSRRAALVGFGYSDWKGINSGLAFGVVQNETIDWGDLAGGAGYFDQAHFGHEFRAFTGLTPTRYVEVRRRFLREHPGHALDGWPLPAD